MSNDNAQYIEDLEFQKAGNQKMVATGERLERLCKNQDFRDLVLQFWMVDETARYAQLSQDPNMSPEIQKDCVQMAAASGHFKRWVEVIRQQCVVAKNSVAEMDAELDRLRNEDDGDGVISVSDND